jgi:outer membrane protein OmpA-like peptidoglycan-associated protein
VSRWNGKEWGKPENLGPPVNTIGEEYSPFIAADGVTLYFSSNGRMGLGGQDIFVTRFVNGKWTEPKNLGEPYNTKYDDIFFSVPASGEYIYFARGDSITKEGDTITHIYRVKLRPELAPSPVTLVKGRVYDASTGGPLRARVTVELLETGETVQRVETDPYSGAFTLILPKRALYGVTAEALAGDFTYSSFNYDLTDEKTYRESNLEIGLQPVRAGASFSVRNFLFDFDSDKLRPESAPELARLSAFMKEHPNIKIIIEGHTDDVGDENYNQALSERRAKAVMEALAGMGVKRSRMKAVGYGETKPLVPNDTEENRQLNRRVEIVISE